MTSIQKCTLRSENRVNFKLGLPKAVEVSITKKLANIVSRTMDTTGFKPAKKYNIHVKTTESIT